MLSVQIQVVNNDVGVFEVAIAGVAVQRFPIQSEHGNHQSDDSASQETTLHYELHNPRHLMRKVEPVNG